MCYRRLHFDVIEFLIKFGQELKLKELLIYMDLEWASCQLDFFKLAPWDIVWPFCQYQPSGKVEAGVGDHRSRVTDVLLLISASYKSTGPIERAPKRIESLHKRTPSVLWTLEDLQDRYNCVQIFIYIWGLVIKAILRFPFVRLFLDSEHLQQLVPVSCRGVPGLKRQILISIQIRLFQRSRWLIRYPDPYCVREVSLPRHHVTHHPWAHVLHQLWIDCNHGMNLF